MISRVLTVGFMLLSVTLACAPASAGPHPCPEAASPPADAVTELARGMTRAFGAQETRVVKSNRAQQAERLVSASDVEDVVPVIASRNVPNRSVR